jgi:hypothetical protein
MSSFSDTKKTRQAPPAPPRERKAWHAPELRAHPIADARSDMTGANEDAGFGFQS